MNRTLHDVDMWHMGPKDDRIIGPREFIFPHMKGWTIDGEKVRMNGLHIKQLTWTQTQRRVLPPPAETTWQQRYPTCSQDHTVGQSLEDHLLLLHP